MFLSSRPEKDHAPSPPFPPLTRLRFEPLITVLHPGNYNTSSPELFVSQRLSRGHLLLGSPLNCNRSATGQQHVLAFYCVPPGARCTMTPCPVCTRLLTGDYLVQFPVYCVLFDLMPRGTVKGSTARGRKGVGASRRQYNEQSSTAVTKRMTRSDLWKGVRLKEPADSTSKTKVVVYW